MYGRIFGDGLMDWLKPPWLRPEIGDETPDFARISKNWSVLETSGLFCGFVAFCVREKLTTHVIYGESLFPPEQ